MKAKTWFYSLGYSMRDRGWNIDESKSIAGLQRNGQMTVPMNLEKYFLRGWIDADLAHRKRRLNF